MSDNKKYYYLKLKDNFFDSDEMIILESMPDGYLYSNILLKLYLRSLKHEGRLMFNNRIPFNSTMLAQVTRHNVGVIEKAMQVFRELELIEVLDSGAIYITDIQNFIGRSSTEADRKREYRKRIEMEKKGQLEVKQTKDKCPDKSPPEIEIEKEIEIEIDKEIEEEIEEEIEVEQEEAPPNHFEHIKNTWNKLNEPISNIMTLNSGTNRHNMTKARIAEYGIDTVVNAIKSINDSEFLKGNNDRGWIITYDWFIKPNNFLKVAEGNYIDQTSDYEKHIGRKATQTEKKMMDNLSIAAKWASQDDVIEVEDE